MLPFVKTSGNGYDLPKGCIVQMDDRLLRQDIDTGRIAVDPNCNNMACHEKMTCICLNPGSIPRFVYWNPNGVAISNDKLIRTICYNPHKAMDGTDIFSKYQKYQKFKNITLNFLYIINM